MTKKELVDLLIELKEYMDDRADADGDSEGFHPNKEMTLSIEISDALYGLGKIEYGNTARMAVDPNYKPGSLLSKREYLLL